MKQTFFIVGPTATGKTETAADVALARNGEVVCADAFQIYRGLDLLTAQPEAGTLRKVRHHLVSEVDLSEAMNAEQFRKRALAAIEDIHSRGKPAFVVGGSGMYLKALTHGLSSLPQASDMLREHLNQLTERELLVRLQQLDPTSARIIDALNKRRLVRALEICLLTGRPASEQRTTAEPAEAPAGVFVFRDRAELFERINQRVELMFASGVVDEVRRAGAIGPTAAQTLGLSQITALLRGEMTMPECIVSIQQATRRYAKRQLTWFRRQTNFEPLNLSLHGSSEAIELIAQKARLSFSHTG